VAYVFTVAAANADGLSSAASDASNAVTPVGAPSAPPAVSVSVYGDQATVTWTLPSSTGGAPVTGYTVTASPSLAGSSACVGVLTTSCVVTGLRYGVVYHFTVTATNGAGYASSYSSPSNAVVALVNPGAPTNVVATPGNGRVVVTWTAPTFTGGQPLSGYNVTSDLGLMCWAPASSTSCTFTGLANGVPSTFAVQAVAQNRKTSAYVASASVVPVSAPSAPLSVWAVEGSGSATVHWKAPASNGGSTITGYTVSVSPFVSTPASCVGITTTSCVFSGLSNGVSYTFRVVATNAAGTSISSSACQAVTPVSSNQSTSLRIIFVKTSTWRGGYQGHFTVMNATATAIGSKHQPWGFSFTLPSGTTLGSLWGATFTAQQRGGVTTVKVTGSGANTTVAAQKFAVISLTVSGKAAPSTISTS
jgi:hypothetical protein